MAPQREWFEKDFYQVLGVSSTASDKEITKAYRQLAKKFHPDANPGSEDRFKEISAAYDVLGDPAKRKEYDEVRRLGPMAGGFGQAGGFPGGGTFRVEDMGDLGDLFGGLFGGGRGGRRRSRAAQRGADVETEVHLAFEDAVRGVTTTVNIAEDGRCHTCGGSGAAPGTSSHTCERCGGRGHARRQPGDVLALDHLPGVQRARDDGGHAVPHLPRHGDRAPGEEGEGPDPPGVEDGQRIRVKGRGAPGQGSAPAGDLFVVVRVGRHARFGRRGRNLTLTVPVTFAEAALGTTITVPTLDGPVTLRVPPGTSPGTHLRVKGRGVPAGAKSGASAGDLLVRIDVTVPKDLTDEQRAAVEAMAAALAGDGKAGAEEVVT